MIQKMRSTAKENEKFIMETVTMKMEKRGMEKDTTSVDKKKDVICIKRW